MSLTGYLGRLQVERAVRDGYDVRGLMYWTLIDNFEVTEFLIFSNSVDQLVNVWSRLRLVFCSLASLCVGACHSCICFAVKPSGTFCCKHPWPQEHVYLYSSPQIIACFGGAVGARLQH